MEPRRCWRARAEDLAEAIWAEAIEPRDAVERSSLLARSRLPRRWPRSPGRADQHAAPRVKRSALASGTRRCAPRAPPIAQCCSRLRCDHQEHWTPCLTGSFVRRELHAWVARSRRVRRLPIPRTIAGPGPARQAGEGNRAMAVHVRLDPAAPRFAPGGTRRGSDGGACKRARQAHARDPFTSPEFDRFGAAESPATPSSRRAAARGRTIHMRQASRAALGVFGRAAASPVERLLASPLKTPPPAPSPPPPGRDSVRSRSCRARGPARASRSCRSSP